MNLAGSTWEFSRIDNVTTTLGHIELRPDNSIGLYQNPNERYWAVSNGQLVFIDGNNKVTTSFQKQDDGWIGVHDGKNRHHILKPVGLDQTPYPSKREDLFRVKPIVLADTPAYCLTVEGDHRRQHHCRSEIDWMGFKETRMIVGTPETECPSGYRKKSFYGSSKNHHQALLDMKARGDGYAAFFEDDLLLPAHYDDHMPRVIEALNGMDWHILFLKSGHRENIVKSLGPVNRLRGGPITGIQYLVRDSGGFLDYLLALTDTENQRKKVRHSDFIGRYIIDWLLLHNLQDWNVYGTAMDMSLHVGMIFKQRSEK